MLPGAVSFDFITVSPCRALSERERKKDKRKEKASRKLLLPKDCLERCLHQAVTSMGQPSGVEINHTSVPICRQKESI